MSPGIVDTTSNSIAVSVARCSAITALPLAGQVIHCLTDLCGEAMRKLQPPLMGHPGNAYGLAFLGPIRHSIGQKNLPGVWPDYCR